MNAVMQTSNIKPKKRSKRKPSDLSTEEVSNVVSLLKNLVVGLDEEDEDGQIVIENVQNVIRKLSQDTVCFFFPIVVLAIDDSFRSIFPTLILCWTPSSMLKLRRAY